MFCTIRTFDIISQKVFHVIRLPTQRPASHSSRVGNRVNTPASTAVWSRTHGRAARGMLRGRTHEPFVLLFGVLYDNALRVCLHRKLAFCESTRLTLVGKRNLLFPPSRFASRAHPAAGGGGAAHIIFTTRCCLVWFQDAKFVKHKTT